MIASKSLAVVRDRDSQSKCFYSIFFPSLKKYFCIPWKLSPPQRPVCLVGRLGRKKKKARWRRWEEQRKGAGLFPSSHRLSRAFCFSIIAIFTGISNGNLCGGESLETINTKLFTRWFHGYDSCRNTRFCHFFSFFLHKTCKKQQNTQLYFVVTVAENSFSRIAFNIPLSRGDMRPISF